MKKLVTIGVATLMILTLFGCVSTGKLTEDNTDILTQETYELKFGKLMLCGEPINTTRLPNEPGCYVKLLRKMDCEWSLCCISACPLFKRQSTEGFCCICEDCRFSGSVSFRAFFGHICVKYTQQDTLKYAMCGLAIGIKYSGSCP